MPGFGPLVDAGTSDPIDVGWVIFTDPEKRRDHNETGVGGLVVEVGVDDDGPYFVAAEADRKRAVTEIRTHKVRPDEVGETRQPDSTRLTGHARGIAGALRDRGKRIWTGDDDLLVDWLVTLRDLLKARAA